MFNKLSFLLILTLVLISASSGFTQAPTDSSETSALYKKLVLREIAGYCNYPTVEYTCLPYSYSEFSKDSVQLFINTHYTTIEEIVIENPSNIIFELEFDLLSRLNRLKLFGNDYNLDGLYSLPTTLLELPSLEVIDFYGVRFPSEALEQLKQDYDHIQIIGDIDDY